MSLEFEIDTRELKKLDDVLKKLGPQITRNAGASALRAAARVIINNAKATLVSGRNGSGYGELAKSLGVKVLRARDLYNRTALVGHRTSGRYKYVGFYGVIVEYGTLASRTEPLSANTRRKPAWSVRGKNGNYRAHRRGMPEGMRPKPHLSRALRTTQQRQIKAMAEQVKKYLRQRGYL